MIHDTSYSFLIVHQNRFADPVAAEKSLLLSILLDCLLHRRRCTRMNCRQCRCDDTWVHSEDTFFLSLHSICGILNYQKEAVCKIYESPEKLTEDEWQAIMNAFRYRLAPNKRLR